MGFAVLQLRDLIQGQLRLPVGCSRGGQGDQNLIGVQPRVMAAQIVRFQALDGLDGFRGDQMQLMVDMSQNL